jgi:murein DD-endopeptidase MepM/ murein hydrolase activator NlpD
MRRIACLALALLSPTGWTATPGAQPVLSVAVRGAPAQPGSLLELAVRADGLHDPRGTAFGRPLAFMPGSEPHTWRALAAVDVAQPAGIATYEIQFGSPEGRTIATTGTIDVQARTFATRRLTVASRFVDPSAAELERIRGDSERLEAIFTAVTVPEQIGPFAPPLPGVPGSNFGTRSVFNGEPRAPHAGADFRGATGTPIASPGAGRVVLAEPLFFTGNTVVIDHGLGLYSLLAHLSRIDVHAGDAVERGAVVGLLGATGRVTGPHLHWGVRLGKARVDPERLLALLGPAHSGADLPRQAPVR